MMDIDIIELSGSDGRFILTDVSAAFVNGIRRIMVSEVPTFAIDEVNIYENTSVLFDEQITLRLGLIPLKISSSDRDMYVTRENCECEDGCERCQVFLTLSMESPDEVAQNQKVTQKVVYSGDLVSNEEAVVSVNPDVPIIKLITRKRKNGISKQKIYLEAIARLGYGREHIKWQAGIACGYKNLPRISVPEEECNRCGSCVDVCPRGILVLNGNLTVVNEMNCSLCRLCEDACDHKGIKIDVDERSFVFEFESDGSYSARDLVLKATDILKEKAEGLIEFLDK